MRECHLYLSPTADVVMKYFVEYFIGLCDLAGKIFEKLLYLSIADTLDWLYLIGSMSKSNVNIIFSGIFSSKSRVSEG